MSETRSLVEVKAHLSELVARVGSQHERVTVTVHGRPTAVLVAVDDLEALEETIALLSDASAMRALADAESELARGDGEGADALAEAMRRRARDCVTAEPYELVIAPTARRQLSEELPTSVAFAAYEFVIGPLLANPHRVGKRLSPPLDANHSARRGTYRVIYRIDDERQLVTVVGVFARADAYRRH